MTHNNRRYAIEAVSFHCIDESGVDFFGSDEPMFVMTWTNGTTTRTLRTQEFGDVDSGEHRVIHKYIAGSKSRGVPGPIGLSVQLYEMDQGDHEEVRSAVDKVLVGANISSMLLGGPPVPVLPGGVLDEISSLFGNDLLGSLNVTFSAAKLEKRLPKVGQSFSHLCKFRGDGGFINFEGGADYDLILRIVRRPDA